MWIIFFWLLFIWQDDLFTDAIEIVDVQVAPWNTIDYDETMIRIWDEASQEWIEYPHTLGSIETVNYELRITTTENGIWFLDTLTGEFWQSQCGVDSTRWLVLESHILCEPYTGKRIDLPMTIADNPVSVSLDGQYAIVMDWEFAYQIDLATGDIITLGEHQQMDYQTATWYGDDWIFIRESNFPTSFNLIYYETAQVSQPNSLQHVTSIWKPGEIRYVGDYVEWMRGCTLVQLNEVTGEHREFETPCDQGTVINNAGDRILGVLSDDFRTRQVMRFNPETGETQLIAEGEIEHVLYADEDYGVILIDDSGWIEFFSENLYMAGTLPADYPSEPRSTPQNLQLAVLALETGEIIYQQPVNWISSTPLSWLTLSGNYPLEITAGDIRFSVHNTIIPIGHDRFLSRISHANSEYSVISTSGEETPLSSVRYVLTDYILYENNTGTYAYDIATGEIIQLVQSGDYELRVRDGEIYVIVHQNDQKITYHIRIR